MTNTHNEYKEFSLYNTVEDLIAQRERWEQGTYAASNTELYALLGRTLDLFHKVRADAGLSSAVNDVLRVYKISFNSSTSLALKIVRLVFVGEGREDKIANRAYTYARVLAVAAAEGITGDGLPKFINDNHGIDEIRRKSKDGTTDAQRAEENRKFAQLRLAETDGITSIEMVDALQPVQGGRYSLALVRKNDDGTASIVFGTNNGNVVNSVLAIAGKTLKQDISKAAEQKAVQQNSVQSTENAKRLAEEMSATQAGLQPQTQLPENVAAPQHVLS